MSSVCKRFATGPGRQNLGFPTTAPERAIPRIARNNVVADPASLGVDQGEAWRAIPCWWLMESSASTT